MYYKLIVNPEAGEQQIIKVKAKGGYFDTSLVIWDERTDGEIPQNKLQHIGYLERVSETLEIDNTLKTAYELREIDRLAEVEAIKADRIADKAERQEIKAMKQTINSSDLPGWHKKILKKLIKDMRN